MILKRITKRYIYFKDAAIIELDEDRSFRISTTKTENGYICYIYDIKGEFDIISFADDYATICYSIDEEYQERIIHILKIPHQKMTSLGLLHFFKEIFTLPGYEHFKFPYYVKRRNLDIIEVHIVNPYNELLINGKEGDFVAEYNISTFSNTNYPFEQLPLEYKFVTNTPSAVTYDTSSNAIEAQNANINIKCPLLYDMMSDKTYSDVVLFSSTGKEILTYRCILAKYSKIFKSLFEEKTELPVQIKIKEFGTDIITAALEFCYGKIDAIIGKESDIFKFADKYEIQELKEACCTYFDTNLNTTNVCSIIEIAYSNNFEDLKEKCKIFIAKNKEEIEFDGLSKNILIDVLKAI